MHSFGKKQIHKNDKFGNKMEFGMIFGKKMEPRNKKNNHHISYENFETKHHSPLEKRSQ